MSTTTIQQPESKQDTINLFDIGVLVNLKVRMWGARKTITRADLVKVGYNPDQLPDEICNLGRKLLVPRSELQALTQIEQQARKALERWSVPFGIANSHFVPAKMLPVVDQQIEALKEEFFKRVDSFIYRFDDLVEKVKKAHPDFWEKCLKGNYPTNPKALRKRFHFDWYTFKIAGISYIEETTVEDIISDQIIRNERENVLRNKMQAEVGEFVGEYVTSMRNETVRFCELMTARISGKPFGDEDNAKKLTPKSISCFRNYVDRFRSMNIFGDSEIEKMLSEFRKTFLDSGVSPKDFESTTVKESVTRTLASIRSKAAAEGNNTLGFINELKRKVIL